jgi:hypothetical protein
VKILDKQEGRIICCKFDHTGQFLVTGSLDTVRVWNIENGHAIHKMSTGRSEANTKISTTPVLRRTQSDSVTPYYRQKKIESQPEKKEPEKSSDSDCIIIEPPVKSEAPKTTSNENSMESYFSCPSVVPTISENLIEETPKYGTMNVGLTKKIISFDTPAPREQSKSQTPFENDDVFYTPCANTPQRSFSCSALEIKARKQEILKDENNDPTKQATRNSESNLWNLVSSVIRVASKKPENSDEIKEEPKHTFTFSKSSLLQRAASFAGFIKSSFKSDDREDEGPLAKRRRIVSNDFLLKSPLRKRQKIQARLPIERMRKAS